MHIPEWETDGLDYKRTCGEENGDYYQYLKKYGLEKYEKKYENHELFMAYVSQIPEEHCLERWTANEAIEFIEKRDPGKPFFLWMSFERPHTPHSPPQEKIGAYNPGKIKLPEKVSDRFYVKFIWGIEYAEQGTFPPGSIF